MSKNTMSEGTLLKLLVAQIQPRTQRPGVHSPALCVRSKEKLKVVRSFEPPGCDSRPTPFAGSLGLRSLVVSFLPTHHPRICMHEEFKPISSCSPRRG